MPPPIHGIDYGDAPLPIEGTRFTLSSFPLDVAGRVLRYATPQEAWSAREYYGMLGKRSAD